MVAVARLRPVGNAAKQTHIQSQSRTRNYMSPEYSAQAASRTEKTHGLSLVKTAMYAAHHVDRSRAHGGIEMSSDSEMPSDLVVEAAGIKWSTTNPMASNRIELGVENCTKGEKD
ncbi:hypothetical protein MGYG_05178 [Nannizzia gypsea CBS 118893]|uniref:Uncharacterized protein n=1 Tax=Arthroderma gypseum (strain ATCC MYA-4604 / CBS 118893) TaxID=535722 RepID=E4UYL2_ARTGP|nr:hypothetical protein MGYG_05178 [Nannizzia gypsea CBS 118893]EFR02175.1 hypothetical protein MGYG_05178 [Nannizzia gypsea CBS 118893]